MTGCASLAFSAVVAGLTLMLTGALINVYWAVRDLVRPDRRPGGHA